MKKKYTNYERSSKGGKKLLDERGRKHFSELGKKSAAARKAKKQTDEN